MTSVTNQERTEAKYVHSEKKIAGGHAPAAGSDSGYCAVFEAVATY